MCGEVLMEDTKEALPVAAMVAGSAVRRVG